MSRQKKLRLDQILVNRNLFPSRNQAVAFIIAGDIKVNGQPVDKPGALFDDSCVVEIEKTQAYVSRGGQKLEAALGFFSINVQDKVILDAGASTGGFTDCLLRRGARKVIAVDVGYGQLAWKLRQDKRVELHERVNLRYLTLAQISEPAAMATVDVSFISVTKILTPISDCLLDNGKVLLLVKPQFEAGRGQVGKGGIVKDPNLHKQVLISLIDQLPGFGLYPKGLTVSPILGAKGNIEFWLYLSKTKEVKIDSRLDKLIDEVITEAHRKK